MTKEKFEMLKEEYIDHVKDFMTNTGGLFPHFSLFADVLGNSDSDKPALIHISIPDALLKNSDTKEELVNERVPEIAKKVKKKFNTVAVAWASEAWMRTGDKDTDLENWQSLPKKEVIIITIESETENNVLIYEIKRLDVSHVNKNGDLVKIDLILLEDDQPSKIDGIFSGLLKKFK